MSEDVFERSPNQTPEEHATEIVDCWQRVGLLVEGHRNLTEYQQSLAEDIRVAEKRGEERIKSMPFSAWQTGERVNNYE